MFKRLIELLVRVADLAEAEGRSLRAVVVSEGKALKKATAQLSMGLAVLVVIAPLAIAGLGLLFLSLFLALKETAIGPAGAAAITGVVTLMVCGGLLWLFKHLTT